MTLRILAVGLTLVLALPALAQAPPSNKPSVRPKAELKNNASGCVQSHETIGKGGGVDVKKPPSKSLSQQLAQSNGVICPPPHVDQGMKKPAPPGGTMPVIPPPGSPGGDPNVQPK